MMRDRWSAIDGKTAITAAELDQAEPLGDRLLTAVHERAQVATPAGAEHTERARAFTLFANAYDEVRRVATFLRWHEGDADTVVPSLYAGRGGSRSKTASITPTPPATAATSDGAASGDTAGHARITSPPGIPTAAAIAGHEGAGLPGASPFASNRGPDSPRARAPRQLPSTPGRGIAPGATLDSIWISRDGNGSQLVPRIVAQPQ